MVCVIWIIDTTKPAVYSSFQRINKLPFVEYMGLEPTTF